MGLRRNVRWLMKKVKQLEQAGGSGLISGVNIKTINGESIVGQGNLAIKSYHTFGNNWDTSTMKKLCNSIVEDSTAEAGMSYYGKFTGSGLPSGLG